MSEQTELEVSIPLEIATSKLINSQFRNHVRKLIGHFGGESISGSTEANRENPSFFLEAIFPVRTSAIAAAKSIRALSLGHAGKSASGFWYTLDGDEMLLFKNKGDLYEYESKSFASVLGEKFGFEAD